MATASLLFAFPQNATLSGLGDNTAIDLGDYGANCADSTNDPDFCKRFGDFSRFTYDPDDHCLLFFGGGHASTMRDDVDRFSFTTLKWKSDYKSTPCSLMTVVTNDGTWSSSGHPVARHTYDQLIYAANTHRLVITSNVYGGGYCGTFGGCGMWCAGKMNRYDPASRTWTLSTVGANSAHVWSAEYDPVSGMIISAGGGGLLTYDPVNDVQTSRLSVSPITDYADNMVYFPPNQKMYYLARNSTPVYEVTLNRTNWAGSTITQVSGMTGAPSSTETGWAYDTANHVIGGGILGGKFYAYDALTKAWTSKTIAPKSGSAPDVMSHCLDYDPVDNVFIYLGTDFHTWAYCYKRSGTAVELKAADFNRLSLAAFPNPFRTSTCLAIARMPSSSNWSLKAFDSRGRLIEDLTGRVKDGQLSWKPTGFSGVAVLQLKAGRQSAVSRVLLLK